MRNLPRTFAASSLVLFFVVLIVLLWNTWGHAADISYSVPISAPSATGIKYRWMVDTVYSGAQSSYITALPTTATKTLDNTKDNQLRIWYYWSGELGGEISVQDIQIDLRRPDSARLVSRVFRSVDVDRVGVAHYSGVGSFAVSDTNTYTTLPDSLTWALSRDQMHRIHEWWWFSGEDDPSIFVWHPVTDDGVIRDTVGTTITPSTDDYVCRVYGYVRAGDGTLRAGVPVRATLNQQVNNACDSTIMYGRTVRSKTDSDGVFSLDLVWSSCLITTTGDSVKWHLTIGDRQGDLLVPADSSYEIPHDWGM